MNYLQVYFSALSTLRRRQCAQGHKNGVGLCCNCRMVADESLSFRFALTSLVHPDHLCPIFLRCFTSKDVLLLQTAAMLGGLILTLTGLDWEWLTLFRPLGSPGLVAGALVLAVGFLLPVILLPWMWLRARCQKDVGLARLAIKIAQAIWIQVIAVTILKTLTGRHHPPHMDESLGDPCVRTSWNGEALICRGYDNSTRTESNWPRPLSDSSGSWFWTSCGSFFCDPRISATGWPSGHTMSAVTLAVALLGVAPTETPALLGGKDGRRKAVVAGTVYAVVMSAVMACTVHWLSDVVSGGFYGLVVALAVIRSPLGAEKTDAVSVAQPTTTANTAAVAAVALGGSGTGESRAGQGNEKP